jgi:thymidylate kinase
MVIIIEGAQGSGKTHLIRSLKSRLESQGRHDIVFYKYQHVDHMKKLGIESIEPSEAFHYFTLSNTLTMLELRDTILKEKILVYDRGIFSAYVWSVLRERMKPSVLHDELSRFLKSDLYNNFHVIRVRPSVQLERDHSDIFDEYSNSTKENMIFDMVFENNKNEIIDSSRNNSYTEVTNNLDKLSEAILFRKFNEIISKK